MKKLPPQLELSYAKNWLRAGAPSAHRQYDAAEAVQILLRVLEAVEGVVVENFPPARTRVRPRWLDGQVHKLQKGKDYGGRTSLTNVRATLHTTARRWGMKVTTRIVEDEIYVQALGR